MANPPSSLAATNQALLETTLRVIDTTKEIIRDYTRRDESIAQIETNSDQQRNESIFQRQKIKEILDAAVLFQQVMEGAVDSLHPSSPIGRLPTEVLLEIFSFAVKQEAEYRRQVMAKWTIISFKGVPIVLARVCSQWRAIVHQNPSLWEHIQIPPNWINRQDGVAHRIARWIAQGVQQRQSLSIEYWSGLDMERLISYVGSHTTPWMSIDLAIMNVNIPGGQWDLTSVHATKVTVYQNHLSQTPLTFFLPLLRNARELTIMGTWPVYGDPPWTSLISLKLRPFCIRGKEKEHLLWFRAFEFHAVLNAAPRLKELEVDFTERLQMADNPIGPLPRMVEHQALNSLSIHLRHFSDNMRLFGVQTSFPALQSLAIQSLGPSSSFTGETGPVLPGIWDQIRSLSLYRLEIPGLQRALRLFVHLRNVDTLKLTGVHVNALVSLMNTYYRQVGLPSQNLPFPRLARVVLRSTDIKGVDLIDMVQTRLVDTRGSSTIQRITDIEMYDSPGVTVEEWKSIQTLLERGRSLIQIGL